MAGKSISHSEDWWESAPSFIVRCTADYKSGGQCKRVAHPGTNVCGHHGAHIPAVRAAAARRIQLSVEDAVARLHEMLDDGSVEARDKIRILHDLLDRGGLAATSKVLVGVVTDDPIEKLFRSIASDPHATYDPTTVTHVKQITRDPAQEALDSAEEGPDWDDLYESPEAVDAELVGPERISDLPPKHIRDAMRELLS